MHEPVVTTVRPRSGWQFVDVGELWRFRELVGFLAWRDIKVRYKQTLLGAAWAVLQPALMMVVFTIFFGRMAGVPSGGMPYPLFAYAGLLAWTFFATAVTNAANSVVGSERLITKVYFPRLAIPIAAVGAAVADFVFGYLMLLVLMAWYGVAPGAGLLLMPLVVGVIALAALGLGTLLAALNVAYRDFRYVLPFLIQLGMFATPTVYMQPPGISTAPTTGPSVADQPAGPRLTSAAAAADGAARPAEGGARSHGRMTRLLMTLNPMTALIAAFRATNLGGEVDWGQVGVATLWAGALVLAGCLYFRRVEDGFADII